jgi:hypothetical protein
MLFLCVWVLLGAGIVAYTFNAVGIIPILAEDPLAEKFFASNAAEFEKLKGPYTVGIHLLSVGATLGAYICLRSRWTRAERFGTVLITAAAILALIPTLKRGPLLFPFVYVLTTAAFERRVSMLRFSALGVVVFSVGALLWYVGRPSGRAAPLTSVFATSLFVEPRELAMVWHSMTPDYAHPRLGATYLAGLLAFVPTQFFPFKDENHLPRTVLRSMGLQSVGGGGPRIGIVGEAWLNAGVPGVLAVCVVFGWCVNRTNAMSAVVTRDYRGSIASLLMTVLFFNWTLSFLSGGSVAFLFLALYAVLLAPPVVLLAASPRTALPTEGSDA